MLALRGVRVVYNRGSTTEVVALRDVSLEVPSGQFVTVVGSNGAGKSSLIQVVSGAARPALGSVTIGGVDVTRAPDYRRATRVARVFDNPQAGTAPELTIEENMALAMNRSRRRGLRFARSRARRHRMWESLEQLGLGLERRLSDTVAQLSAGQRQSLTLLMAGLCEPEVLLLDEHLAALDPGTQATVMKLTVELVEQLGCTALMVTHNMAHALQLGDRLLVMSRGRVIADLDRQTKAGFTVSELVNTLSDAGDVLSDRVLLA